MAPPLAPAPTQYYRGSCHCGAITLDFYSAQAPSQFQARTCACDFCSKHGAIYISDSEGRLTLHLEQTHSVQRYRFASCTADFILCKNCGALVGVTTTTEGKTHAVLNARCLPEFNAVNVAQALNFDGESIDEKQRRRANKWIAEVEIRG